jgi:PQQ-dependent dehydrogenase (s-GDH family)
MMKSLIPLLAVFFFTNCEKEEEEQNTTPTGIVTRVLTQDLSYPWEILWGPDNFIWATERGGKISRINPESGAITPVVTIAEVSSQNEGGLLGMALHPDFSANPYVFVVYNYNNAGSYREKVVRFSYNGSTLTNPVILVDNIAAAGIHNGSRLLISADQKLFISTGDAANTSLPQDNNSLNGKVLRINLDGSIPSDNPNPASAVWTKGHRNIQGLVFAGNTLFASEHGPESDDEINIIEKGRNYGWPNVRGACNESSEQSFCSANNIRESIRSWTPTIATCGIDYYNHDLIPQWKNSLLMATLKNSRLVQLKLNASQNSITELAEFFTNSYGRMRDLCISPEGRVYICTSNGSADKIVVVEAE